jgi:plasmid stabilization system protein ParE
LKRSVVITPRARAQIGNSALWWAQNRSSIQAAQWLAQLELAISGLAEAGDCHPLAAETDAFDFELRQMLFGLSGKRTHRVLFAIHDHRIVVYAVRQLAQRDIDRTDIE